MAENKGKPSDEKQPNIGGRPPSEISKEQRRLVRHLTGLGLKADEVAKVVKIPVRTLYRRCREELDEGLAEADAQVMQSLFRIATGKTPGATAAAIFWAKTRRGMAETQKIIHGADESTMRQFVAEVIAIIKRRLPDSCPHCKTHLELGSRIVDELRAASDKLAKDPPPEYLPRFAKGDDKPAADGPAKD